MSAGAPDAVAQPQQRGQACRDGADAGENARAYFKRHFLKSVFMEKLEEWEERETRELVTGEDNIDTTVSKVEGRRSQVKGRRSQVDRYRLQPTAFDHSNSDSPPPTFLPQSAQRSQREHCASSITTATPTPNH